MARTHSDVFVVGVLRPCVEGGRCLRRRRPHNRKPARPSCQRDSAADRPNRYRQQPPDCHGGSSHHILTWHVAPRQLRRHEDEDVRPTNTGHVHRAAHSGLGAAVPRPRSESLGYLARLTSLGTATASAAILIGIAASMVGGFYTSWARSRRASWTACALGPAGRSGPRCQVRRRQLRMPGVEEKSRSAAAQAGRSAQADRRDLRRRCPCKRRGHANTRRPPRLALGQQARSREFWENPPPTTIVSHPVSPARPARLRGEESLTASENAAHVSLPTTSRAWALDIGRRRSSDPRKERSYLALLVLAGGQAARETDRLALPLLRQTRSTWAARSRSRPEAPGLVEGFARGVVQSAAQLDGVRRDIADFEDVGVATGGDEARSKCSGSGPSSIDGPVADPRGTVRGLTQRQASALAAQTDGQANQRTRSGPQPQSRPSASVTPARRAASNVGRKDPGAHATRSRG